MAVAFGEIMLGASGVEVPRCIPGYYEVARCVAVRYDRLSALLLFLRILAGTLTDTVSEMV